jgi:phosphate transport system protein
VAADLRFIIVVLKINNDLERVGDLAVNICENALAIQKLPPVRVPFDLTGMAEKVRVMVKKSLDALVNLDAAYAQQVCSMDDDVDRINREMYSKIKESIISRPQDVDYLIHLLSISRHLERIADHATNISRDVVYLICGEIVRHQDTEA